MLRTAWIWVAATKVTLYPRHRSINACPSVGISSQTDTPARIIRKVGQVLTGLCTMSFALSRREMATSEWLMARSPNELSNSYLTSVLNPLTVRKAANMNNKKVYYFMGPSGPVLTVYNPLRSRTLHTLNNPQKRVKNRHS